MTARQATPIDLNVSWIVAQRRVDGQPLYDRPALTSPATVAALVYLTVVVRLLSRVRYLEDDAARALRDHQTHADGAAQRYSFA